MKPRLRLERSSPQAGPLVRKGADMYDIKDWPDALPHSIQHFTTECREMQNTTLQSCASQTNDIRTCLQHKHKCTLGVFELEGCTRTRFIESLRQFSLQNTEYKFCHSKVMIDMWFHFTIHFLFILSNIFMNISKLKKVISIIRKSDIHYYLWLSKIIHGSGLFEL